jgi:hypothetical protein
MRRNVMTTTGHRSAGPEVSPWATGFAVFASILMIMLGVFHAIAGIVAIIDDEFFVTLSNYTFEFDRTTWGWIHLISGVLVAWAGYSVLSRRPWARGVGIVLAMVSAIENFLWLPYYPVWSIVSISLAVAVIWALSKYGPSGT